jgi:hypothetical protein
LNERSRKAANAKREREELMKELKAAQMLNIENAKNRRTDSES